MLGAATDRLRARARRTARSGSTPRCSRTPNCRRWDSTSGSPRGPMALEAVAVAPTAAVGPRVPSPLGRTGLPGPASRGSDSSPSPRPFPSPGSMRRPGTSGRSAPGPGRRGCRGQRRRPARERSPPTRHPSAPSWTAEATVSFALPPSPKDFPLAPSKARPHVVPRCATDQARPLDLRQSPFSREVPRVLRRRQTSRHRRCKLHAVRRY